MIPNELIQANELQKIGIINYQEVFIRNFSIITHNIHYGLKHYLKWLIIFFTLGAIKMQRTVTDYF